MNLVDTSSWVEYLRDRESEAGDAVEVLVLSGEAAWCNLTLVELWHGVRGTKEKRDRPCSVTTSTTSASSMKTMCVFCNSVE